ncbi:hypothetical protein MCEREM21A_02339 [Sphingomonadaceae bacterium]
MKQTFIVLALIGAPSAAVSEEQGARPVATQAGPETAALGLWSGQLFGRDLNFEFKREGAGVTGSMLLPSKRLVPFENVVLKDGKLSFALIANTQPPGMFTMTPDATGNFLVGQVVFGDAIVTLKWERLRP